MTNTRIQNAVTSFFEHFEEALLYIRSLPLSNSEHPQKHRLVAQKLFCCALIDTLSIARFGGNATSAKFKKLLKRYVKYPHWDRVSIPQVLYNCERTNDKKLEQLKLHATKILANREGYLLTNDPICSDITKLFPRHKKAIENCTHVNLFYKYRNRLVHEMREPGYGYEFDRDDLPCYRSSETETHKKTFQLTYPIKFFFKTCKECIQNLPDYFEKQQKSPYDAFELKFGDVW